MKACYKCCQTKPFCDFSKDTSRTDGYSNKCKECRKTVKTLPYTEFVSVQRKVCTRCRIEKDRDQFRADSRRKDGLSPHCTECRKRIESEWRDNNRLQLRSKARESIKTAKIACRRYVIEYLGGHPCVDCGEDDLLVLDFDHMEPSLKRYSISKLLASRVGVSMKKLIAEIEKCVVRCANCHRRRTIQQFGSWKLKILNEACDETS